MTKSSAFTILLSLIGSAALAYDSDPGYGARGEAPAARSTARSAAPAYYYKPTMRYYGKGYVVTYRYVQWNDRLNKGVTTSFESTQHKLPAGSVQAVAGREPRVTYYYGSEPQAAPQPARSSGTAPAKEVPPISGAAAKKK